ASPHRRAFDYAQAALLFVRRVRPVYAKAERFGPIEHRLTVRLDPLDGPRSARREHDLHHAVVQCDATLILRQAHALGWTGTGVLAEREPMLAALARREAHERPAD